jgi:ArsR family transcriptional regulator
MSDTPYDANLEARADLFKALGHPMRLLILNLLQSAPRHGEELAAILRLSPATISHHLMKLAEAGLAESRRDQYYLTYSLRADVFKRTLGEVVSVPQQGLTRRVSEDAYRARVLKTFLKHGRLRQIPGQLKKRQIILTKIAEEFEPERDYTEMEVNRLLVEFHEDVATLRREMVGFGLMKRSNGIYRRVAPKCES